MGFGIKLPSIKIKVPTVRQLTGDVGKAIDRTVKDIGRSDIGKTVEAVTAPVRSTVRATESLARGDLEGFAGNIVHAAASANPVSMAMNASSSIRDLARNEVVNTLSLGMSKDLAELSDKGRSASYGRQIDGTDWSVMGRTAARGVVIGGAIMAAPMLAGAASGVTLGEGITAAGVIVNAAKNPEGAITSLANTYLPGSGDFVRDIVSQPGRSPASPTTSAPQLQTSPSAPQVIQMPGGGQINSSTLLIIGAVGILGLTALYALKR